MDNYSDTARALASQIDNEDQHPSVDRHSSSASPGWSRRSIDAPSRQPQWMQTAEKLQRRALGIWFHFTPLQRAGLVVLGAIFGVLGLLALIYKEHVFIWLGQRAKDWRDLPGGWAILWIMTILVAFPPMIGYSMCVTIAGFVFGMKGWFIMSTATVVGSTISFLVSRTVLKSFVSRMTEKDKQFAALSLVLKHDGLKLLIMIRLCPLPYSLSNGAISTIPTVTWLNFLIATAIATPKLLLHIFVGAQLGILADPSEKLSLGTRIVSYLSIFIGVSAGIATGYFIYTRTQARAAQIEAEEAANGSVSGNSRDPSSEYVDDDPPVRLARSDDDISLHQTYADDLEAADAYRDGSDEDAVVDVPVRDVFDIGDSGDEDEDEDERDIGRSLHR